MLSYAVTDRDRERLVEDLDLARQFEPTPMPRHVAGRHHWFRRALAGHGTVRTHLANS